MALPRSGVKEKGRAMGTHDAEAKLLRVADELTIMEGRIGYLRRSAEFLADCISSPGTAGDPWERFMAEPADCGLAPGTELLALVFREYDTQVRASVLALREQVGDR
jgi:hypothetical protein